MTEGEAAGQVHAIVVPEAAAGSRVWVVGSAQRRFVDGPDGTRSRIEVVADEVRVGDGP